MDEELKQDNGTVETEETKQEQGKDKLFTQDEVNGFIQTRLGQMKRQASKENTAEVEQRLKDIEAREMKLLVRERLIEKGMPQELSEVLSCTGNEDLENKLECISKIYGVKKQEEQPRGFQIGSSNHGNGHTNGADPVRGAFGLNR